MLSHVSWMIEVEIAWHVSTATWLYNLFKLFKCKLQSAHCTMSTWFFIEHKLYCIIYTAKKINLIYKPLYQNEFQRTL